jgi:tetratricopeptide (TPR) repeat protein
MSSSDPFRVDPFANPFAPTDRNTIPTASIAPPKNPIVRRPMRMFFILTAIAFAGAVVITWPAVMATWRISDARGKSADRQDDAAIAELDKAIEANPNQLQFRLERIRIASRLGQVDKAKADLEKIEEYFAAQSQPISRSLREQRCQYRQLGGAFRLALEDQAALLQEVKDADAPPAIEALAMNNHAYSIGLAVEKEPKEEAADRELLKSALADCDRALKLVPDQGSTLDTRGYIHFLLGDHEAALKDLDRAVEIVGKEVAQARLEVNGNARQLSQKLLLREIEYSAAVMYQHRMKAHQKAGNEEAVKKDRQAIIDLGYKPDVFLQ